MNRKRFHLLAVYALALCLTLSPISFAFAQDSVTGAFEGRVTNAQTKAPIPGALLQFIHQTSEARIECKTDAQGKFYQGRLEAGDYLVKVNAWGFQPYERTHTLTTKRGENVVPLPIQMEPEQSRDEGH